MRSFNSWFQLQMILGLAARRSPCNWNLDLISSSQISLARPHLSSSQLCISTSRLLVVAVFAGLGVV